MSAAALVSSRVDDQLLAMLTAAAAKALSSNRKDYFATAGSDTATGGGDARDYTEFKLEIEMVISCLFFLLSFGGRVSTPGMRVFNLIYDPTSSTNSERSFLSKSSMSIYSYFAAIYIFKKLKSQSILHNWRRVDRSDIRHACARLLKYLEIAGCSASLVNFALFLRGGRYPTLLHRLTNLDITRRPSLNPMLPPQHGNKTFKISTPDFTDSQLSYTSKIIMFTILMTTIDSLFMAGDWPELQYIKNEAKNGITALYNYSLGRLNNAVSSIPFADRALKKMSSLVNSLIKPGNRNNDLGQPAISDPMMSIYPPSVVISFGDENINYNQIRSNLATEPTTCCACQLSPSEYPHALSCGHIYCFMCLVRGDDDKLAPHAATSKGYICTYCSNQRGALTTYKNAESITYLINKI